MIVVVWCYSFLVGSLLSVKTVFSFETQKNHYSTSRPTPISPPPLFRVAKKTRLSVSRFLDDTFKTNKINNNNEGDGDNNNINNKSYLRWRKDYIDNTWNMETAVTTFQRGPNQKVDLHAQVHFGDKSYFEYYNTPEFNKKLDYILYELLVDDNLLEYNQGHWRLKEPIMASPSDQKLAQQYGWDCQATQIDYTQNSKWIHADLSRQEFMKLTSYEGGEEETDTSSQQQPLWKLASAKKGQQPGWQSTSAAAEAVSALFVGPPTLSYDRGSGMKLKRRLFTNLFLPGSNLANILRAILWMNVPSPELSIILLDWSSLLPEMNGGSSGKGGGNPNALSKVAIPILSSMVKFDIPQIRRFLFGQVLISSNTRNNNAASSSSSSDGSNDSAWSLLVTKRNDHALDVLQTTLLSSSSSESKSSSTTSAALLYGSSHCPDLHMKLKEAGFKPIKTTWRTAWSIQESSDNNSTTNVIPSIMAVLVFYLGIGACDWVAAIGDVSESWIDHNYTDFIAAIGLYLVRHVLLYLGLSKFLIDWTNNND